MAPQGGQKAQSTLLKVEAQLAFLLRLARAGGAAQRVASAQRFFALGAIARLSQVGPR